MAQEKSSMVADDNLNSDEEEDTQEGKFLTFPLGKEQYGLEIRFVTEIVGIQKITKVTDMPDFIKGVINLRGQVIPIMDVRLRFNLDEQEYHDRTCIVVVNINDKSVGLIVDTVTEVLNIPANQIEPPPIIQKDRKSRFIKGMGKTEEQVTILLETNKLLFGEETKVLEDAVRE